jgi:2-octaprenyl-6-methoxyphenol hydroxylase
VRLLRDIGMTALDLLPGPKWLLTRQFMGLNGRLPRLSRGLGLND